MDANDTNPDQNFDTDAPENNEELELQMLRERAKTMGIPIAPNLKLKGLRKKIADHLEGESDDDGDSSQKIALISKQQLMQQTRENMRKTQLALVRCQIYNLNPEKNDLRGEIITVANKFLGTVRRMVPFGDATERGYHIEQCIFNDLKERKFQQKRKKKGARGDEIETRMVPEYNLVVLPTLSPAEIQDLAVRQAAAQRVSTE